MADGKVGGNESVHWLVNADKASGIKNGNKGGKKWQQSGIDYHNESGLQPNFTIRIKLPNADINEKKAFLTMLSQKVTAALAAAETTDRLEFLLKILRGTEARTQVQICWGETIPPWDDDGLEKVKALGTASGPPVTDV